MADRKLGEDGAIRDRGAVFAFLPLETQALRSCVARGLSLVEPRRFPKFPLNGARQPMHRSLADLARLTARLELGRDLLQKFRPPRVIDRPGQGEQHGHLFVVELQWRHGASPERGPGRATLSLAPSAG
jgi:hypothetical protein